MAEVGRYYDGETGQRLTVEVTLVETGVLRLSHPELQNGPVPGQLDWPFDQLRALPDQARDDQLIVTLVAAHSDDSALIDNVRLTLVGAALIHDVRAVCPLLDKRDVARGTGFKVVTRLGMAVAAFVLMIFVILPAMANTFANLIPIEREVAYGKTIVRNMERVFGGREAGQLMCSSPKGDAALARMVARLTENTPTDYDLNIAVMNNDMVNAFAAPGGQIVIMKGLIDKAKSADEVAAVLGHEIAHVESRDPTRGALRAAGSAGLLSMVFGDFTGGGIALAMTQWVLDASYTREAETQADVYARDMLGRAGVSTAGMATFFRTLEESTKGGPDLPTYLSSHPSSGSRSDLAASFAEMQSNTTSVINEDDWKALRSICDDHSKTGKANKGPKT
ncbi:M48 family metallopeptidase [Ascidiaceihabitans sp.]|uniref:M48 family metallopeptidase n=1 Tax=Ascidiaceihabitans sp. TaxID=1872644 RepID=UPI003298F099